MIFSTLKLNGQEPIYEQIERQIEKAITTGEIMKGSKLPSTREVSNILGVSRNSVLKAYENLESRALIYSIKGKGSFINQSTDKEQQKVEIDWNQGMSHYASVCNSMDIIKTEYRNGKEMISFKSIAPEGTLFDIEEFKRAFLDVMALEGEKLLNYGYAKGYNKLIDFLYKYMEEKGVSSKQKDILVTNGFTEALDIMLSTYTRPGDIILCETPTHHTSIKMMKAYGIQLVGIPMDEQGIKVQELEEAIIKYNPRWLYITPSYQNPTGIVMSGERRRAVYKIISQYQLACIEDGFNEELLYSSSHLSPMMALAGESNHVIYLGSLSKILFPGLRIGWIMADKNMIEKLESVKRTKNIHTSFLDQAIFVQYMKSGSYGRYVKKARKLYREKYLFIIDRIKELLPVKRIWGEGGLYVYIELDEKIDTRILLDRCYKKGVLFMPGDIFTLGQEKMNSLRLGFARLNEEEIEQGLTIINEVIQTM